MSVLFWFVSFAVALVIEISFLPHLSGGWVPTLTTIPLLAGIAVQSFPAGLLFAALAGMLRDVVAGGGIHLLIALGTFFSMRLFLGLTQWEKPLGAIAAVAVGLILQPVMWFLAAEAARPLFHIEAPTFGLVHGAGKEVLKDILFTFAWFGLFSWLAIRRARRNSERRLRHI